MLLKEFPVLSKRHTAFEASEALETDVEDFYGLVTHWVAEVCWLLLILGNEVSYNGKGGISK
jgi:tellurite resistance protein TehA-like permease